MNVQNPAPAAPACAPHLPLVLVALQLGLRGHDGLDELAFGTVLEAKQRAFQPPAALHQGELEVEVQFHFAGEALEVVHDHHDLALLLLQEGQQRLHGGAMVAAAGESLPHGRRQARIALHQGVVAAALLLAVEAIALAHLLAGGDAAVDHAGEVQEAYGQVG